jgi:hypothetical protein
MVDDGVGVLLSIFFELLLEDVNEDGETACSARAEQQLRRLVAGWPKTSRRGSKSGGTVELENSETWQWQHRGRVSLFIAHRSATVSQPTEVGTSGAIRRLPHGAR